MLEQDRKAEPEQGTTYKKRERKKETQRNEHKLIIFFCFSFSSLYLHISMHACVQNTIFIHINEREIHRQKHSTKSKTICKYAYQNTVNKQL